MSHYPQVYDVGPHCNLLLWITEYGDAQENNAPWTIREIYTTPFCKPSGSKSVLGLLLERLDAAVQTRPHLNPGDSASYVHPTRAPVVKKVITDFMNSHGDAAPWNQTLSWLMANTWKDNDTLKLAKDLDALGIYIPFLCVLDADKPQISALLYPTDGSKSLWDLPFPRDDGGTGPFGDLTERVLHRTARSAVEKDPAVYAKFRQAIVLGILRHNLNTALHSNPTLPYPDPAGGIAIRNTPNGKCCNGATCQTSANPRDYCATTTGIDGDPCNALSDPCS